MEASWSVEAIRGFLPPSSVGLLSLGVAVLAHFIFHLGFVGLSAFPSGCMLCWLQQCAGWGDLVDYCLE